MTAEGQESQATPSVMTFCGLAPRGCGEAIRLGPQLAHCCGDLPLVLALPLPGTGSEPGDGGVPWEGRAQVRPLGPTPATVPACHYDPGFLTCEPRIGLRHLPFAHLPVLLSVHLSICPSVRLRPGPSRKHSLSSSLCRVPSRLRGVLRCSRLVTKCWSLAGRVGVLRGTRVPAQGTGRRAYVLPEGEQSGPGPSSLKPCGRPLWPALCGWGGHREAGSHPARRLQTAVEASISPSLLWSRGLHPLGAWEMLPSPPERPPGRSEAPGPLMPVEEEQAPATLALDGQGGGVTPDGFEECRSRGHRTPLLPGVGRPRL